jgi:hypothetical protein
MSRTTLVQKISTDSVIRTSDYTDWPSPSYLNLREREFQYIGSISSCALPGAFWFRKPMEDVKMWGWSRPEESKAMAGEAHRALSRCKEKRVGRFAETRKYQVVYKEKREAEPRICRQDSGKAAHRPSGRRHRADRRVEQEFLAFYDSLNEPCYLQRTDKQHTS